MSYPKRRLGQLVELHDNRRVPLSGAERAKRKGPYPYYGAQGVIDWIDDFRYDGSFLLVPEDGENLRSRKLPIALVAEGQFWVNNHAHVMAARTTEADQLFLQYAIEATDIRPWVTGAAQPKLSQEKLRMIDVPCPRVEQQTRIAHVLMAFDGLIGNNRRRIELLEETTRSLYREWFIRSHVLSNATLSSWTTGALGKFAKLRRTNVIPSAYPGELFAHCSIPAYDSKQVPSLELGSSIKSSKYLIDEPVILVSKLNPRIKRVWRVKPTPNRRTICSTEFLPLVGDPAVAAYLYGLVTSEPFSTAMSSMAGGTSTSHQRAKPDDFLALPVLLPDDRSVLAYSEAITPMLDLIDLLRIRCEIVRNARDLLLPKLVTGQIDVGTLGVDDVFGWTELAEATAAG